VRIWSKETAGLTVEGAEKPGAAEKRDLRRSFFLLQNASRRRSDHQEREQSARRGRRRYFRARMEREPSRNAEPRHPGGMTGLLPRQHRPQPAGSCAIDAVTEELHPKYTRLQAPLQPLISYAALERALSAQRLQAYSGIRRWQTPCSPPCTRTRLRLAPICLGPPPSSRARERSERRTFPHGSMPFLRC
jgi:hypothetical protein